MPPTVSINLCCYNSEKYIYETIESIVNQTYDDWELVVINDGSTDSTENILKEFINRGYPIKYHYQDNKGLGYSRKEALKYSNGDFIAFIDHDDIWLPDKLKKQIPLFDDPYVGLVFSDVIFFNDQGVNERYYKRKKYWTGMCFRQLLTNYFISLVSTVVRHSAIKEEPYSFDTRFKMIEEADLFRRIAYKWKLAMINEPLAKWRIHSDSVSWKNGNYLVAHETKIMLEIYDKIIPDFSVRFKKEINILKSNLNFSLAYYYLNNGENRKSRKILTSFQFFKIKTIILFFCTFFPSDKILFFINLINKRITPSIFRKRKRYMLSCLLPLILISKKVISLFCGKQNCVSVLMYHNIPLDQMALFEEQIKYLKSIYNFITPEQFEKYMKGEFEISGINLLITFDDGFRSQFYASKNVLDKFNIKGIFFVINNFINMPKKYLFNYLKEHIYINEESHFLFRIAQPMKIDDLQELLKNGHKIGSHTFSHVSLSNEENITNLNNEIIGSKEFLMKKLGIQIDHFAFPFGRIYDLSQKSIEISKNNYKFIFTGIRGTNNRTNDLLYREEVSVDYPLKYLHYIIEGGLSVYYLYNKRRLKKLTSVHP